MFINEQARRLGDLAAGTLVVHDQATVTLDSLSASPSGPAPRISAATETLPLERLTDQDIQMPEDYLRRRYELANSSTIAQTLLEAIYERMGLPAPQLAWLECKKHLREIVQAKQSRHSS